MKKAYVCKNNSDEFFVYNGYGNPENIICDAPIINGRVIKSYELSAFAIDEIKKTITINQTAYDLIAQERSDEKTSRSNLISSKDQLKKDLKNSLSGFNSMTAGQKWALVKKLIEVI